MPNATVHRFRGYVAITLPGTGGTQYISPEEAHLLANELKRCAVDVETLPFSQSQFETTPVHIATQSLRSTEPCPRSKWYDLPK